VMSHEMRTPLNGIVGSIELLEDTRLTAAQGRYISAMKTSAGLLLHHVNGVLSMSRAEAGQLDLIATEVEPAGLLHELVESQRHVIEANGNKIICDTSTAPDRIWVDPHRLRQLILNLVGNANKFTRQGEIRVECDVISNTDQVEFRVIDNGIGIAEDDIDRIFEEFRTLDTSYSRRAEGTGLGLAISRRLAHAMKGEIGVDSELGEGSLFWVRLPIGEPTQADRADYRAVKKPAPEASSGPDTPLQILLVEDNEINRLVARDMLLKRGHSVFEAHDGREGVHFANRQKFDVILMDISMPDLDGVAATGMIRAVEGPNRQTPIIALTAHALKEDTDRFLAAGITDILIKPLTIAALQKALTLTGRPAKDTSSDTPSQIAAVHAQLSTQMGSDRANQLYRTFIADGEAFVGQATSLPWDSKPLAARADSAHKLAGSAAVLGALCLQGCLQGLESDYRQGREAEARQKIADLNSLWDQIRVEIVACLKVATAADQDFGSRH
jgi:two-component system, sensor histidine kinase